jgi:hypothetical protein
MSIRIPVNRRAQAAGEPPPADTFNTGSELDPVVARNRDAGKERARRPRFGEAISDAAIRAATGAIAVSFAVVSRKHWPR